MIRLLEDAFNMTSLALYASVGFDTKHPVALMDVAAGEEPDPTVRPVTPDDLPVIEEMSRGIYRANRRGLEAGFRNVKVMNLMALGPYEEPEGVWLPSVLY